MKPTGLLEVTAVRRVTPRVVRVTFTGAGLDSLEPWPDQQLKLLFPPPGRPVRLPSADDDVMRWYQAYLAIPAEERPVMRSYTVRSHDRETIDVDFVLHSGAAGPATAWAARAAVGDVLGRYGPDPAYRRPLSTADTLLCAGDETAIPAIASLLSEVDNAVAFVEVADAAEEQPLPGEVHWLHRNGAEHGSLLLAAVREAAWPSGSVTAWLAGEAGVVRSLRRHLVGERGLAKNAVEFTGYWRRSLTQDDAPTPEDLADAAEKLEDSAGWKGN
ncbi:NADPH-dependent ferric siderophore reductase, contains FAD-binding and SIP domains [Amycolatopsis tolypomycina]|uniref:NADPH-dependent ferric siderophore reductase, contains FAD-binding and SIP domains n=1 Tax=Amycolatopsis tolypomycina TaxID=208445 RepID=A0A1H4IE50_9PSEU|nr:siderophore-interacting protein [Amycolatopsis tolypomycina]SEB32210.1 NADPH-dependent ferric siderophore reductase, contains FAD-binding and SIP domains [Amycolatopsis tolypomycina]